MYFMRLDYIFRIFGFLSGILYLFFINYLYNLVFLIILYYFFVFIQRLPLIPVVYLS